MALSGDAVRRIREAFNEATGTPLEADAFAERFGLPANSERDGLTGPGALALRYLSQGLPGFRGNLSEWSYQRTFYEDKPDQSPMPAVVAAVCGRAAPACVRDPYKNLARALDRRPRRSPRRDHRGGLHRVHAQSARWSDGAVPRIGFDIEPRTRGGGGQAVRARTHAGACPGQIHNAPGRGSNVR